MPNEINPNDMARINNLQQRVREKTGGLSESTILTPEEARKIALMKKIEEQGY